MASLKTIPYSRLALFVFTLALVSSAFFVGQSIQAQTSLTITGINGNAEFGNKATIYWRTNLESACTLAYSTNADTSNGTTVLGRVIQVPTNTNDGLYYYDAKPNGLASNTVYYYKIMCPDSSNNSVESAIKSFNSSNYPKPDLTISEFFVSPKNPKVGEAVIVNANIKNLGGVLTSGQGINNIFRSIQNMDLSNSPLSYIPNGDPTVSKPFYEGDILQMRVVDGGKFSSAGRMNIYFKVDNADELAELDENNNVWQGEVVVGTDEGLFEGDGSYELGVGERVKIDNGVTVKVKNINQSSVGYKGVFEIYDASGKLVKTTDTLNVSSQAYSFSDVGARVSVSGLGHNGMEIIAEVKLESIPISEGKPDLELTNLSITTDSYTKKQQYTIEVTNSGSVEVKNTIYVKLENLDSGQVFNKIGHYSIGALLQPGKEFKLSIPDPVSGRVRATVDPDNLIEETNESNNTITKTLTIFEGDSVKPDLIVTKIEVLPVNASLNDTRYVEVTVKNKGDASANINGSYLVLTYGTNESEINSCGAGNCFGTGNTYSASIALSYLSKQTLTSGEEYKIVFNKQNYLLDDIIFEGGKRYLIKAFVDHNRIIAESNENNNSYGINFVADSRPTPTGNITGGGHTVDGRIAKIQWRTDGRYNCSVVFKGRSDIGDDLIYPGAGISIAHAGEQTSLEVDLGALNLPNRESDKVVYYKIVCRDRSDGHKVAESDVNKLEITSTAVSPPPPSSNIVPIQNDPEIESGSSEIQALRERIKKLERQITELERQVVEAEKRLTRKINRALAQRVAGRILLQVDERGEAWYVDTLTEERFYLQNGDAAYNALQAFGLGITNSDLDLIPIGVEDRADKVDSDGDGLDDQLEEAIGSDPNDSDTDDDGFDDGTEVKGDFRHDGPGSRRIDRALCQRLEGKILLQVEGSGEAWYVRDCRRHYMKDGDLAYQIMRFLSLGITNDDLRQIAVGELE